MALQCSTEELQRLLDSNRFSSIFGYRIKEIGDGECRLDVPYQESFDRPGGIVSGQVYMAAADVAMWLAIKTRLGFTDEYVTAEMKTNFLGAARRENLVCSARVIKFGRRLIFGVAECTDDRGRILAHHTLTYIRAEAK